MKDFWAEGLQNQRKGKVRKVIMLVIILLIIIAILALIGVYFFNMQFRNWCDEKIFRKEILQEDAKYIEIDGDENTQVYAYEKYICVFGKKKLEYYNKVGTKVDEIELVSEAEFFIDEAESDNKMKYKPNTIGAVIQLLKRVDPHNKIMFRVNKAPHFLIDIDTTIMADKDKSVTILDLVKGEVPDDED
jgi:hypothetical protein